MDSAQSPSLIFFGFFSLLPHLTSLWGAVLGFLKYDRLPPGVYLCYSTHTHSSPTIPTLHCIAFTLHCSTSRNTMWGLLDNCPLADSLSPWCGAHFPLHSISSLVVRQFFVDTSFHPHPAPPDCMPCLVLCRAMLCHAMPCMLLLHGV